MFIYMLAYLDRANLEVAKLQMQVDLGFTDYGRLSATSVLG